MNIPGKPLHLASLALFLMAVWLLWSGFYYPLFIGFGLGSVALVLWVTHRMDVADHEGVPVHLGLRTLSYWPWLLKEIALSNIDVTRRILSPSLPISPCTFEVTAGQHSALGRTIYANSITLTPGTVSMSIDGDRITVHALTEAGRDALLAGEMDRRASRFEGDAA